MNAKGKRKKITENGERSHTILYELWVIFESAQLIIFIFKIMC